MTRMVLRPAIGQASTLRSAPLRRQANALTRQNESAKDEIVEKFWITHKQEIVVKEVINEEKKHVIKEEETDHPGTRNSSAASGCDSAPEAAESRLSDSETDIMKRCIELGSENDLEVIGKRLYDKKEQLSKSFSDIDVSQKMTGMHMELKAMV